MRTWAVGAAILAAILARGGCDGRAPSAPALQPARVQRDPTADRPIVVAFDEPETLLIFGGPDGTLRKRLPQPKGFLCYAFAPDGKSAAVCLARDTGVAATVYDPSGTPVVEGARGDVTPWRLVGHRGRPPWARRAGPPRGTRHEGPLAVRGSCGSLQAQTGDGSGRARRG